MKDSFYVVGFLLVAFILLVVGRDQLPPGQLLTWAVSFGGVAGVLVLVVSLVQVREQLRESQQELARTNAEIHFAREVQRELFPRRMPTDGGLEMSAACLPAQGISGDSYDVLARPDGRTILSLADVSGKGISAAILMANLHALLRILAETEPDLRAVCRRLNQHLYQVTEPAKFATLFLAEWDPASARLSYVNAGHQCPIIAGVEPECALASGGPPIGLFPDTEYESGSIQLDPESVLVLFSDGVPEATASNGEEFGTERLRRLVSKLADQTPAAIESRILDEVRRWSNGPFQDDVTLVTVRAGKPPEFAATLADTPSPATIEKRSP